MHTTGGGTDPRPGGKVKLGYFTDWGVYGRNYFVEEPRDLRLRREDHPHQLRLRQRAGGKCTIGDSYADYDMAYTADKSVTGVADTWDQPLRGNFNQLRQLKAKHPNLKIIWSFGGWTWSGGFGQAAQNPAAFAALLLQPGRGPALGRRLRRHRHRLGVPQRLRSVLRHLAARTP